MPEDSIMVWVNNEEGLYNDVRRMYDGWVEEGDSWDEADARKEALELVEHIAEAIEGFDFVDDKYSSGDKNEAVDEILEDFEDFREEAIEEAVKEVQRKPKPEDLVMDAGEIEYTKKMEELAQRIGIQHLRGYMPASAQKIRTALERGDKHLNSIPLRKWDDIANMVGWRNYKISLSDMVGALKHVARWHYA